MAAGRGFGAQEEEDICEKFLSQDISLLFIGIVEFENKTGQIYYRFKAHISNNTILIPTTILTLSDLFLKYIVPNKIH